MKFIVDANLPLSIANMLNVAGHDAVHTSNLPLQNQTTDRSIIEFSLLEQRIIITKDTDFYHSLLLKGEPHKLILIRFGNVSKQVIMKVLWQNLRLILEAIEKNRLIEVDIGRNELHVIL